MRGQVSGQPSAVQTGACLAAQQAWRQGHSPTRHPSCPGGFAAATSHSPHRQTGIQPEPARSSMETRAADTRSHPSVVGFARDKRAVGPHPRGRGLGQQLLPGGATPPHSATVSEGQQWSLRGSPASHAVPRAVCAPQHPGPPWGCMRPLPGCWHLSAPSPGLPASRCPAVSSSAPAMGVCPAPQGKHSPQAQGLQLPLPPPLARVATPEHVWTAGFCSQPLLHQQAQ